MIDYDEPFEALLENLRSPDDLLRAALIYRLSSPTPEDFAALQAAWEDIPVNRKRLLLSRLLEASEISFEADYSDVALFALSDEDEEVRAAAIECLWENEHQSVMHQLTRIMQQDEAAAVRAAAAQALGRFVLASELGDLSEGITRDAEQALLDLWFESGEPQEVRRRALESLAYSGRDEIPSLIEEAWADQDLKMQASAIFAMGRSADERWEEQVLHALYHTHPELRYEAARAAGELLLTTALPRLIDMLREADREVMENAIWSLGEIGGNAAKRALMDLADGENDDALLEIIEDALNTAALSTGEFATYLLTDPDAEDNILEEIDELMDLDELDLGDEPDID